MPLSLIYCLLIFVGIILGLGWPLASRLRLDPAEKLTAAVVLSLLTVFLVAWAVYVADLPLMWLKLLPLGAALGLLAGIRSLCTVLRDPDARILAIGQFIIMLWSVVGLALVVSYSGGSWVADWFGHLQRVCFFLERGPRDILFNGFDPLTSRPPLANIVNGAFLEITQLSFARYQLFSTLFSSLVFLPAGLLAIRFGGSRAIPVLILLFMVNPMYAQNVTYAWTKLPAAFFTLASLYFFLRAHDDQTRLVHGVLFATTLAAALLTHYSAGPYAMLLGMLWFFLGRRQWSQAGWRRATAISMLAGVLLLSVWFGWTFAVYGVRGSLLTNTSVTDQAPGAAAQLHVILLNLRDTLVPHFLRSIDPDLLAQGSSLGWWRDWFFQLYQVNFFFVFGSVAWIAILTLLFRQWKHTTASRKIFWIVFIVGNAILGVAVVGGRYFWGLVYVCLQPLVLLGLAFLAAQWHRLGGPWRLILIAGATVDFALGIFLQFGVQSFALEQWFTGDKAMRDLVSSYSIQTRINFGAKINNHWVFVGDVFADHRVIIVAALAGLFLVALWLGGRAGTKSMPRGKSP